MQQAIAFPAFVATTFSYARLFCSHLVLFGPVFCHLLLFSSVVYLSLQICTVLQKIGETRVFSCHEVGIVFVPNHPSYPDSHRTLDMIWDLVSAFWCMFTPILVV